MDDNEDDIDGADADIDDDDGHNNIAIYDLVVGIDDYESDDG